MFYSLVLSLHNLNRWLVLFLGLWTTCQVVYCWLGRQSWQTRLTTLIYMFTRIINLQFLLGVTLYLLPGAFIQGVLQNVPWAQVMKERLLRFFTLEHPLQMLIAIAIAHSALATAQNINPESRRFVLTASLLILSMLLILLGIPWPGFDYGRPWLRLPW